jgi:N-acetyl-gamma-glutamylphosphate reductase
MISKETAKRISGGFGGRTNEEVSLMTSIKKYKISLHQHKKHIKKTLRCCVQREKN